jgi:hypothetical protein
MNGADATHDAAPFQPARSGGGALILPKIALDVSPALDESRTVRQRGLSAIRGITATRLALQEARERAQALFSDVSDLSVPPNDPYSNILFFRSRIDLGG